MPIALDHLRGLNARDQRIVVDTIDDQLTYQPDVVTRHRKPLEPNDLATWELRIGDFRAFYDILQTEQTEDQAGETIGEPVVTILAVGFKMGSRLFVGGEEIEL